MDRGTGVPTQPWENPRQPVGSQNKTQSARPTTRGSAVGLNPALATYELRLGRERQTSGKYPSILGKRKLTASRRSKRSSSPLPTMNSSGRPKTTWASGPSGPQRPSPTSTRTCASRSPDRERSFRPPQERPRRRLRHPHWGTARREPTRSRERSVFGRGAWHAGGPWFPEAPAAPRPAARRRNRDDVEGLRGPYGVKRGTEESNLALRFWRPPCYRYTSPPGESGL